MVRSLVLLLMILAGSPVMVRTQEAPPPLRLEVLGSRGGLAVHLGDLLADPSLQEALESGLPLRIVVVVELWRDGFFDSQVGQVRWRASVVYDPLAGQYLLELDAGPERGVPDRRTFPDLVGVRVAFPRTLRPALQPDEEGRYYYLGRVSVETLSLSDLEELERWLRGDLAPAISGESDVDNAVERGLRRAMIRLLGMPARRFDTRTATFDVPDEEGSS